MAYRAFDRVHETTTTTGTGDITPAGAVTKCVTFTSVLSDGDTFDYAIVSQSATEWETGLGTWHSSGSTFTRTNVYASSNSGSLVTFSSGTKDVFMTIGSGHAVTPYLGTAPTLTTVSNTTTQTVAVSIPIAANQWADGQVLQILLHDKIGATATPFITTVITSTSGTGTLSIIGPSGQVQIHAGTYQNLRSAFFIREGTTIHLIKGSIENQGSFDQAPPASLGFYDDMSSPNSSESTVQSSLSITSVTFSSAFNLQYKITWGTANAANIYTPISCRPIWY